MIVISGALVVIALVLLVLGVTGPDITRVYGSIVVSLVSLVFLVLGILQRRGEVLPAASDGADRTPSDDTTASAGSALAAGPRPEDRPKRDGERAEVAPEPAGEDERPRTAAAGSSRLGPAADSSTAASPDPVGPVPDGTSVAVGTVLVVANRPRYHSPGCRYLVGKQTEEAEVLEARGAGFTACGVCKPDEVLAGPGSAVSAPAVAEPADVPSEPERTEPVEPPSIQAPPLDAPLVAGTPRAAAVRVPQVPRTPAEQVVVIPDRNRYHRSDCRHVRGFPGAETVTTAQAAQQGYTACGVCQP